MRRATITQKDYVSASQLFHWATREHYQIWFTGSTARHKRTEVMLPRLVAKGKLVAVHYGKRFVYTIPRRVRNAGEYRKVEHGLGVTEGLVRLWRARNNCFVIPERYFYGCGAVSEFGLLFPNKKLLLYEHCSKDNFDHTSRMVGKLRAYEKYITTILRRFNSEEGIVLFVVDTSPEALKRFLMRYIQGDAPFFFVDYHTFKTVEIGNQLTAPIYLWGADVNTYPLSNA